MTGEQQRKRRALIVRRWAAYRVGRAQREIWEKRRAAMAEEFEETASDEDDLLAGVPETLLG